MMIYYLLYILALGGRDNQHMCPVQIQILEAENWLVPTSELSYLNFWQTEPSGLPRLYRGVLYLKHQLYEESTLTSVIDSDM